MKITSFKLKGSREEQDVRALHGRVNDTRTDYPRDRAVHEVFREQAAKTPAAKAVISSEGSLTYEELEQESNRIAGLLVRVNAQNARARGPGEPFVGLLIERSPAMVAAMLGVLKAGCAYLPINPDFPLERIRYLLRDTRATVLMGSKAHARELNRLQWECPDLRTIVCLDSSNFHAEIEPPGGLADLSIWEAVGAEAFDDISAGGWKDSYTGDWLSREVMDEYGDNIKAKLAPLLTPGSRVFEVGCASGISMFRLAPLVAHYHGTDISPAIARWAELERQRRGLTNVRIDCCPAHEIHRMGVGRYDVVVINSVIECFNGHNYLRDVLRKAIGLLGEQGCLFLGNLWDQDKKDDFVASLRRFKAEHEGEGYHTKVDREDELYVSRSFLEDLRLDFPEITRVETSIMHGQTSSELSMFGFDAVLHVDKRLADETAPFGARHRYQYDRRHVQRAGDVPVPVTVHPDSLAYLIYTSGTSGVPKGVMIEHRSILRLVRGTNYIDLGPNDRVLATGSLAFDASTFEIWGPLLNGGAVCFARGSAILDPRLLGEAAREHGVNTIFLTTALFNRLVESDIAFFAPMKTVLSGGEKVNVRAFNALRRAHPSLRLLHVYGPTETTTFATWFPVERVHEEDIPIGKPLSNTTVYILDQDGDILPPGAPGELCIGGEGLSRGYWGDPALTARKFIPHPFARGERLYRTGDLVKWTAAGDIEFVGRVDRQVKIRGYRVEPEEVEQCLLSHPDIEHAAVVCAGEGEDRMLIAYASGRPGLTAREAEQHVTRSLPAFMLPAHMIVLPELPLNENGKVDRRRLPPPEEAPSEERRAGEPPATDLERHLAAMWSEALGVRDVLATDNFFDLGGHSLKVPKLVSLIESRLGIEIPYIAVYNADTLRDLASYITDRRELLARGIDPRLAEETLVPLSRSATGPKVFAFPPGSGFPLAYVELARLIEPYALQGLSFIEASTRFEEYVDLITSVDPEGPYVLFGYSGGGKLAFDVAAHLEAAGKRVAAVVMLDAARYHQPVRPTAEDVRAVAAELLDNLTSRALKERAFRKMSAYRHYLGDRVESEVLRADIHLIVDTASPHVFHDDWGAVLASVTGWSELTRGAFLMHQGKGAHRDMLGAENVADNARILKGILDAVTASRGRT